MNAKEQFREVVKKRGWHGITADKAAQRAAAMDKTLALAGKLSYEKSAEWLRKLGYVLVQEESWAPTPHPSSPTP